MNTADALESGDDVAERRGRNVVTMEGRRGATLILIGEATQLPPEKSVRGLQNRIDYGEPRVVLSEPRFMRSGQRRLKADSGGGDQRGHQGNADARCRSMVRLFDGVRTPLATGLACHDTRFSSGKH